MNELVLRALMLGLGDPSLDPSWLGEWEGVAEIYPCTGNIYELQRTQILPATLVCQTDLPLGASCTGYAEWDAVDVDCTFDYLGCTYEGRITGINSGERFWGATFITGTSGSCFITTCERWEVVVYKNSPCPAPALSIEQERWGRVKGVYR